MSHRNESIVSFHCKRVLHRIGYARESLVQWRAYPCPHHLGLRVYIQSYEELLIYHRWYKEYQTGFTMYKMWTPHSMLWRVSFFKRIPQLIRRHSPRHRVIWTLNIYFHICIWEFQSFSLCFPVTGSVLPKQDINSPSGSSFFMLFNNTFSKFRSTYDKKHLWQHRFWWHVCLSPTSGSPWS